MKKKLALTGFSAIVVIVVILVVINLISVNLFGRVDLTEGSIYSLSESSKDLVRSLNDRITIKCFFTEDLEPPYNANARYVKDQLDEYKSYSGGNLSFTFVDPGKEKAEAEAKSYRIPAVPMRTLRRDKMEIKQVYMGLVILYEDKQEVIPVIQSTESLEYEITRAIRKLTNPTVAKVAFTEGHGELNLKENLTYVDKVLGEEFELQPINLKSTRAIPADIQTLYVIGPKTPFSRWELYLLDQFLMRGGKVGLLIDRIQAEIQQSFAQPIDPGFDAFLKHFNVNVNSNMVIDAQCAQVMVEQQQGPFRFQSPKEYPMFPKVTDFSKDNLIVKDLESINMIFASTLDTTQFQSSPLKIEVLARTSKNTGILSPPYSIDPMRQWTKADFISSPQPVGVAITGNFTSFFAGQAKPDMDTVVADNLGAVPETRLDSGDQGRLVVWGDADFVSDQVLRDQSNLIMFQNMTDWLSQDQGLISIRSKDVTARPLDQVEDSTRSWLKFVNIFLMPAAVIAFGVARWQIRRQNRRRQLI
jgi:gliding-associated putative ABC transporter substrate-binding component GldG